MSPPLPRSGAAGPASLRRQLLAIGLVTTAVALLVTGVVNLVLEYRSVRHDFVGALATEARVVGRAVLPAVAFDDPRTARLTLATLVENPAIAAAAVYVDGRRFAEYVTPGAEVPATWARDAGYRIQLPRVLVWERVLGPTGDAVVVYLHGELRPWGTLLQHTAAVLLAAAVGLLLALLLSRRLHARILTSLDSIGRAAEEIVARRDFSQRATPGPTDELGRVARAFNAMLDELQARAEALRDSEARARARAEELRIVLDATPAAILIAQDPHCTRVVGSRMAHEILRTPFGENLSKTADDRPNAFRVFDSSGREVAPDQLPVQRVAATGRPLRGVREEIEYSDGTRRVLFGNVEPILDGHDRVLGVVAAYVDISPLAAAEAAVREGARRLTAAASIAELGLWEFEPATRRLVLDARCLQIFGVDRAIDIDELAALIHPDDRRRNVEATQWALAHEHDGRHSLEYRIVRPDGSQRWLLAHGHLLDPSSERRVIVGTLMDVSERRQALETIERQREELQTLLDVLPVGVAIAHDRRAERVSVSPFYAQLLGVRPDVNASQGGAAAERLPWRFERHGRELPGSELPLETAVRSGRPVRDAEVDVVLADGRTLHLLCNAAPLFDAHGQVRGAVSGNMDVTVLKQAQRELEAASRQKDEFLATLAHELRNPMAPIRYAAALLKPDTPPAVLEQARRMIERQSAHMSRLLDDLLDMSRITRNVIELQRAQVDLRSVVADAVEAAQPELALHRHTLSVNVPDDPAWIDGDPARLLQIVGNLLGNAIKYTPPGGRLEVTLERQPSAVRLRVSDSGIGLAPEMLPRVFELFSQLHRGSGASQSGLGIGLAVVRRLVELHGGHVAVSSAGLGQGAEFTVVLPSAAAAQETPAGERVTPLFRAARRVLIVDDHHDVAQGLALLLRSNGIVAHVVHTGEDALDVAERLRPEVIVLDLGLPTMSGEQVALELRRRPWARAVRIIAVTGWGQEADRARTRAAGFDLHLVKPVDPDALLELVCRPTSLSEAIR